MEIKKISKWDAAPESIKNMQEFVNALYDPLPDEQNPIIDALSKVLDDYNKLEAKHQLDCGLISDYAEENARLKQKNEKASNNIRDLRRVLEENDIATYLNPVTVSWGVANIALQKKTEHFNTQLDNLREKLKEMERSRNNWHAHYVDMADICSRNEDDYEMLQRMLEKDGYTVEYDDDIDDETVHCRCTSDYIHRETTPDEVTIQFGRWTLTRPQAFSEAKANADAAILRNQLEQQRAQTNAFSKSNNDLRRRLLDLRHQLDDNGISSYWSSSSEINVLDFNNHDVSARASIVKIFKEKVDENEELNKKIKELVKENETLKDTLEKDVELAKLVGENVVECIKYGAEHGYYEVHPLNKFDIHIEEAHVGSIQDRHAIPKIVVRCNNIQTQMERDTAEHECEELNKKMDTVWRVNDELNRKIKELAKENIDLKTTLSMCERDANMAKNLCDKIRVNAERARNKTPWFNDASCNNKEE